MKKAGSEGFLRAGAGDAGGKSTENGNEGHRRRDTQHGSCSKTPRPTSHPTPTPGPARPNRRSYSHPSFVAFVCPPPAMAMLHDGQLLDRLTSAPRMGGMAKA